MPAPFTPGATDHDLDHLYGPLNPVGGTWSNWVPLGGSITDTLAVAVASAGGNVVFARGMGGDLTHTWQ